MGELSKRGLIALINLYRDHISPVKRPSCRFSPTCSAYAVEAIEKYGALKGTLLAVWRILRCNPFGKGGFDPVK
jgi:putative membrane protein insertion efficiency factor